MKKLIFAMLLVVLHTPAMALNNWSTMSCNGADKAGKEVHLLVHSDSSIVNINGTDHKIAGKTKNGKGVITENFFLPNGLVVYDSLIMATKTTLNFYQFNAITQALLAHALLTCLISGNAPQGSLSLRVTEQGLAFNALRDVAFLRGRQQRK